MTVLSERLTSAKTPTCMSIMRMRSKGSLMNSTATGNSVPSEKGIQSMEINANGTYFQKGDQVCIKSTGEIGRINARKRKSGNR